MELVLAEGGAGDWPGALERALTVEAVVELPRRAAEGMQVAVAQWALGGGQFSAFDAWEVTGAEGAGFFGAVFDGRHVYFCPMQHTLEKFHGRVLRYDTQKPFGQSGSFASRDAGATGGLDTRGYYGGAFDGRHVYFVPRKTEAGRHSRVLRYDTRLPFAADGGWASYDAGLGNCRQGAAFDGRYVYFAPGYEDTDQRSEKISSNRVLRLDTLGEFQQASSWKSADPGAWLPQPCGCYDGAVFDGRYVYFVPLRHETVLRFDTEADFEDPSAWASFRMDALGANVGAVFDGRYLYFAAYGHGTMVRLNTRGEFASPGSWEAMDLQAVFPDRRLGFDGGFYDGRYVHFVPFIAQGRKFHANFARYDTRAAFLSSGAWQLRDVSRTGGLACSGYNAGAFDGRYFYCAPWRNPQAHPAHPIGLHATILRCDTAGPEAGFLLKASDSGHNGGLCAAVPGPSFLVNTEHGPASVSAGRVLEPGRHALAGVYDGRRIRLFVDGHLAGEREASGRLTASSLPVTAGRMACGSAPLDGRMLQAAVTDRAKEREEIAASCAGLVGSL